MNTVIRRPWGTLNQWCCHIERDPYRVIAGKYWRFAG